MDTYNFRLVRRLHLARFDLLPVDAPEERVSLDVLLTFGVASQTLGRQFSQELHDQSIISRPNHFTDIIQLKAIIKCIQQS